MKVIDTRIDSRYSGPLSVPTPWDDLLPLLTATEIYTLTTILPDGMPHTVPLTGAFDDLGFLFGTGPNEQKVVNITNDPRGSVQIGSALFAEGVDIVLRGRIERVTDRITLAWLAETFVTKYGEGWRFGVGSDSLLNADDLPCWVFRLVPEVGHAFVHGERGAQTPYEFASEVQP
ncbi:MAG: pyridoxamine 5'-phosphate oxidase family protein [Thermomicrobiales bacterium]|nr:pyridoxamine 5'-phosphate oxidase family protein [Thermomicrobiales bacterium]